MDMLKVNFLVVYQSHYELHYFNISVFEME